MGTNECSQSASKSSWDSQDFGDVNMVLKMAHFHKSSRAQLVKLNKLFNKVDLPVNSNAMASRMALMGRHYKQKLMSMRLCFF